MGKGGIRSKEADEIDRPRPARDGRARLPGVRGARHRAAGRGRPGAGVTATSHGRRLTGRPRHAAGRAPVQGLAASPVASRRSETPMNLESFTRHLDRPGRTAAFGRGRVAVVHSKRGWRHGARRRVEARARTTDVRRRWTAIWPIAWAATNRPCWSIDHTTDDFNVAPVVHRAATRSRCADRRRDHRHQRDRRRMARRGPARRREHRGRRRGLAVALVGPAPRRDAMVAGAGPPCPAADRGRRRRHRSSRPWRCRSPAHPWRARRCACRALTVLAEAPNHVVTVESLVARLWRPDTWRRVGGSATSCARCGRCWARDHGDPASRRSPRSATGWPSPVDLHARRRLPRRRGADPRRRPTAAIGRAPLSAVPLAITLAVVAWHLPAVHDGTVITERIPG